MKSFIKKTRFQYLKNKFTFALCILSYEEISISQIINKCKKYLNNIEGALCV